MVQFVNVAYCDKLHPEHTLVISLNGCVIKGERHQPPEKIEIGICWHATAPTNEQANQLAVQLRLLKAQFGANLRVNVNPAMVYLQQLVNREMK